MNPAKLAILFRRAAPAAAVETDPSFSSVTALLHFDGSNGSTTITDSSSQGASYTCGTGVSLSTTSPQFGTAALNITSTGALTSTTSATRFGFPGAFTVEGWVNPTAVSALQTIFDLGADATRSAGFVFYIESSELKMYSQGSIRITTAITAGWHHVALTRDASNVWRLFVDGTPAGSTYTSSTDLTAAGFTLGNSYPGGAPFAGKMDEWRITKGVCRYDAAFTPRTSAFPDA